MDPRPGAVAPLQPEVPPDRAGGRPARPRDARARRPALPPDAAHPFPPGGVRSVVRGPSAGWQALGGFPPGDVATGSPQVRRCTLPDPLAPASGCGLDSFSSSVSRPGGVAPGARPPLKQGACQVLTRRERREIVYGGCHPCHPGCHPRTRGDTRDDGDGGGRAGRVPQSQSGSLWTIPTASRSKPPELPA